MNGLQINQNIFCTWRIKHGIIVTTMTTERAGRDKETFGKKLYNIRNHE